MSVAVGMYDAANGETFPLVVPDKVGLFGDEARKGASIAIVGSGCCFLGDPYTILLRHAAVLAGFTVTNPGPGTCLEGVIVAGFSVIVRNNSLVNTVGSGCGGVALYFTGFDSQYAVVTGNIISHNRVGVAFVQLGGPASRFESNVITNNGQIGVEYDNAGGDLGGGPTGSAGGNTISCNGLHDLFLSGDVPVDAQNNFWDHNPPTIGFSYSDADIGGGGFSPSRVNMTGSQLAATPCP